MRDEQGSRRDLNPLGYEPPATAPQLVACPGESSESPFGLALSNAPAYRREDRDPPPDILP